MILAGLAVLFVLYLIDTSSEKIADVPRVRDSVKLCGVLEDFNEDWRELEIKSIPRSIELKELSLSESSVFETPIAELVEAEISGDRTGSVGIRHEISRICDSEASTPLPP